MSSEVVVYAVCKDGLIVSKSLYISRGVVLDVIRNGSPGLKVEQLVVQGVDSKDATWEWPGKVWVCHEHSQDGTPMEKYVAFFSHEQAWLYERYEELIAEYPLSIAKEYTPRWPRKLEMKHFFDDPRLSARIKRRPDVEGSFTSMCIVLSDKSAPFTEPGFYWAEVKKATNSVLYVLESQAEVVSPTFEELQSWAWSALPADATVHKVNSPMRGTYYAFYYAGDWKLLTKQTNAQGQTFVATFNDQSVGTDVARGFGVWERSVSELVLGCNLPINRVHSVLRYSFRECKYLENYPQCLSVAWGVYSLISPEKISNEMLKALGVGLVVPYRCLSTVNTLVAMHLNFDMASYLRMFTEEQLHSLATEFSAFNRFTDDKLSMMLYERRKEEWRKEKEKEE